MVDVSFETKVSFDKINGLNGILHTLFIYSVSLFVFNVSLLIVNFNKYFYVKSEKCWRPYIEIEEL